MKKGYFFQQVGMVLALWCLGAISLSAQSGTAFRDFNGDGTQTGAEPGVKGIIVRIYGDGTLPAKDAFIGETVTGANGNFNFATLVTSGRAANPGEKIRIEFTIPASAGCDVAAGVDFPAQGGSAYGTSVQFINGQQSGVKFAINFPGQWVEDPNPLIMLPCYSFGDPNAGGDAGSKPSFISYRFLDNGVPASHNGGTPGVPDPTLLATIADVGSLYGVAFSRQAQKVFTSAVLRRHAAFGPLGPGGIYLINPFGGGVNNWLDLDAVGIWTYDHLGSYPPNPGNNTSPVSGFIGTSAQRGLGANAHTPSTDYAAGDQIGKVSIGDIDISDDGRYLYVTNLWDRKIYEIDLVDPKNPQAPTAGNLGSRVRSWDAPDPGTNAAQGEHRPWGLKFNRGKLLVGVVLTGQDINGNVVSPVINVNGQQVGTELRGYVYELDPSTSSFTQRLNFSFNYGRERGWIPWGYRAGFPSRYFSGDEREVAEPIISDLEVDDQGNLLIGILDRKGHQYAINNNNYAGQLIGYEYSTAGELLRADADNNCVYSIVSKPGTTDYYDDNIIHPESLQGPLAVLPGGGDAVAVVLDPILIRSGGTIRFNNSTGARVANSAYEVFDDRWTLNQPGATPSKANGLGDVELTGDPAPIEIGNRVWADIDRDGIQDSGEPGIPGVDVQLKWPDGTILKTVTTDGNGNYFFNKTNVPDGDPTTPGNQPGLLTLTNYKLCIPASEFANGQTLNNAKTTDVNAAGAGVLDYSDSDGMPQPNGDVMISLTTGNSGENNHSYDFGIVPVDFGDLPNSYGTTEASNGPWHFMNNALKLGACVDGENDGQPEAMAGMNTGGDDNTVGLVVYGDCGAGGDDENGITFSNPLIPGSPSCVTVNAMNMTGNPAVLQGWIDFNGNGTFEANEQLNTGSFAGNGAIVPVGGLTNAVLCFDVPANATFQGGAAFSRFRLSPNGGLGTGGGGVDGEVEDHKVVLAKVGTLVWNDYNNDGIQNEAATAGINGINVNLTWLGPNGTVGGGDDVNYTATTALMGGTNGTYMFIGLIPGMYKLAPGTAAGYVEGLEDQGGNDFKDGDEHDGVMVVINNPISLVTNENGTGDVPGGTNGFPDAQDNLSFDWNYVAVDYGDLPNTYGTTISGNGPRHTVNPNLKLGANSDGDPDGQPDSMAGAMVGGDDNDADGDDEDGITVSGPMIPGNQACFIVNAMNMTGSAAVLQAWIDFNGDGLFQNTELVNTGSFAGPNGGAAVPNGGLTNATLCFTVPNTAIFNGGQAMMRFRLSPGGNLNATGVLPNGQIPTGEVEDYKVSLAKVGTYVWNDYNNNGQQDEAGTAGLNGVTVNLTWLGPNGAVGGGDDVVYTATTATMSGTEGTYMFVGLTSGMYKLSVPSVPATFTPTLLNAGSDVTDADDPTGVMVVINNPISLPLGENGTGDNPGGTNGFPDAQDDLTYDFGYIQRDYGDLPDTYGTTSGNGGPSHIVDPNLKLGTCVDAENNGIPEPMAGAMTGGDDNTSGANVDGGASTCGDDEDGITFITPLIPGYQSCVRVNATNNTAAAAKLQAWMDFNGNGTFDSGEQINTGSFAPSGATVPVGGLTAATLCFDVPSNATFQGGKAMVRFRLSQNGGLNPGGADGNGEVEDYKVTLAKIGNLVWTDYNNDGQQNEPAVSGINGAGVQLVYAGFDNDISTAGDNLTYTTTTATMTGTSGIYMFLGLTPGIYKVSVPVAPNGQIPTVLNVGPDVTDADDPTGVMVTIPSPVVLPLAENGMGDNPGGTNGFPDAQDNLTFDFGYVGFDFGDLPDTYHTRDIDEGPKHVVTPDFYLGTCVDSEVDATPDPMAGLMGGGDDGTAGTGTQGTCAVAGDDENGIVFDNPLIPGAQACIRVTAHNNTGSAGKLQGWIDFNGNGTFEAGEQLNSGDFTGNGATIPTGDITSVKYCFTVPANATFTGGQAMVRFRLSKNGGLQPGNPVGTVPVLGEVEDYKVPLAKTGNLVWWDYNNNGLQETGEPGINGANIQLTYFGPNGVAGGGDDVTYNTTTSTMNGEQGVYMFLGLISGAYKINVVSAPNGFQQTLLNQGNNDNKDADDPSGVMVMIPNPINLVTGENGNSDNPGGTNGFPDNQDDISYDFGYIALDFGDAPNSYGTNTNGGGPRHLVNPNLYLGTCVDGDNDGQPEPMAGLMTAGDDNNNSAALVGSCGTGDDENGIVSFETPLIPGYSACIRVTATNTTGSTAVLQGWIDFNGNGTFEAGEQLNTGSFAPSGASIPNGGVVNMQFCFTVPANATFAGGQAFSRFRLSPNGGLTPGGPATGPYPIGEVEDYKTPLAKIGNLVWNDWDNNGQQNEPGSAGLNNVTVNLVWAGQDLAFNTPDDRTYVTTTSNMGVNGQYMFWGLIPGPYKVVLPTLPTNFIPTQLNIGSDVSDSDNPAGEMVMVPDPIALPLGENSTGDVPNDLFPDPANNLTVDFGLITRDFGDLPDTYGTTDASPSDGAVHVVNPNLKLGSCEDGELDGQPDSMAGLMTGGDDNTGGAAVDGTASTCGDDEDGIVFETPMIPGYSACIRVTALNNLAAAGVLQMWVDFNGDGDVADAGEAVTSGSFNGPGGGAIVPVGGLTNAQLCFDVPASAIFADGSARVRFRISPSGNQSANGPENMPFPVGEVEDYKVPVAKVGNLVWNDNNNDGIQNEAVTNGLNNILVQLVWAGPDGNFNTAADNRTYTTNTGTINGVTGMYMFWGLTSGAYKLSVPTNPAGFIPTQLNIGSDVTDADDPTGVMVMIPNPIVLPTGENGTGDQPGGFNGYPDNQDDLTYDFGYVSVDYGDLPNTYSTDIASGGPRHVVNPTLRLGLNIDGELNGQPEAMAGFMTGGDDNNQGAYNEGGAGDDESGIVFKTPLIPGFDACLTVTTINNTGTDARLQIWIDFNGDGDVNDANERLNTGAFTNAAGALVTGGTLALDYCFTVPADATFAGGAAFLRARLSRTGNLPSSGPATMPYPIGEVEDYKIPVAKAGNLVWIDANVNGIQDENVNLGIDNVTVQLVWAGPDGIIQTPQNALTPSGDDRIYTDVTETVSGVKGKYLFCGLTPSQSYQMRVPPFGYVPTLVIDVNGNTQDFVDSDQPLGVAFNTNNLAPGNLPTGENGTGDAPNVVNGYPDNQNNQSIDFGYLGFDFGDAPNTYATTQASNGAVHTVTPDLYLGPCVDIDIDGQPEAMAGFMTGGDDGNAGPGVLGSCAVAGDDENGISFPTPLVPGNQACVKVTARNNTGGAAVLQAWIDFNGNGTFEANEQLTTGSFSPAGASIPNGGVTNQNFCFDVPATATFNGGNMFARFRLSKNGGTLATGPAIPGNGQFPNGEVEDYKLPLALIGNYVWMDNPDIEGDQDATEMPLADVKVNLIWAGEDGVFQTPANSSTPIGDDRVYMVNTNALGYYEYRGLIPSSSYRILPEKYTAPNGVAGATINPKNKILTIPNLPPNDNLDSDGTPLISVSIPNLTSTFLPTGENGLQDNTATGFPDNQTNVSLDFGFIDEPKINAAMAIVGFDPTVCGEFAAIMDLCIKNTSTAPLASLQAVMDLAGANAYGAAFKGVIGAPVIVSSTAHQNPVPNAGYNGNAVNTLFDGVSGLLWPGEQVCIRVKFGVDPDIAGAPANPKAQARVTAKAQNFQGVPIPDYWNGGAQYVAADLSDDGTDAMSTNPGFYGDTGGSDDPSPLGPCWHTTQENTVCNDLVYVSMAPDCSALVHSGDLLEGEDDDCDETRYPLGGFFTITITTLNTNQPVPNPIPPSYAGQTLKYSVKHIMSCNSCWGTLKLEDKLPPVLSCSDIHLNCAITNYTPTYMENVLHLTNANPTVTDCSPVTVSFTDTWHDVTCNQTVNGQSNISAYVERIWTAKDSWNNQSTCTQYIYFDRIHVYDIQFPVDAEISCSNGNASPSVAGVPYFEAFGIKWPLWPDQGYCELATTYSDDPIVECDGTTKILRTWKAIDWCLPTSPLPPLSNPLYFIQVVKVVDHEGPAMNCPANLTVGTDPFTCCATINLPDIIIKDNCSRVNNIEAKVITHEYYTGEQTGIYTVGGTVEDFPGNNHWDLDTLGNYGFTPCLPLGKHTVVYTSQDDCGNTATCKFDLTVLDYIPPVAACDETTTVAIGGDDPFDCYTSADGCDFAGVTWVKATTFNDGSYDNCNQVKVRVRRMNPYSDCINNLSHDKCYPDDKSEFELATAEADSIKFYCCEVGTTQTVVLAVYQVDVNGVIMLGPDGEPIKNECMVQVEVQDKLKPACLPPANVSVNCENFDPSLWAYGKPTVADNCCLDTSKVYQGQCGLQHSVNYSLFDTVCNKGTITRTFRVFDCHGLSSQCTQRVIVNYEQDYFVKFPNDVIVTVCDGTGNYGEPLFYGEDCELLGVSYEDEIFTVVPDACFKIERTWTIINWCTYNPNGGCIYVPNPNPNPIANATANLAGPTVSAAGTLAPWAPTNVKINPTDPNPTNYSSFYDKNANCYKYKQIIKIIDGQAPTGTYAVPACDNQNWNTPNDAQLWNEPEWWNNGLQTHDLCEEPTDLCITGTDACSGANINIEYLLFLDLDGDGVMESVVNSVNTGLAGLGWNNVQYNNVNSPNFSGGVSRTFDERAVPANQKYGFAVQETVTGNNKTACVRFNTQQNQNTYVPVQLPHGTHKIKWFITDGCGNNKEYEETFTVKDCKAPTVVCLNGLSTNIMPTGMITLWASDFLQYTEDNCTPASQIKIGIRKCGTGTGFPVDAQGNPITSVTFTCTELGTQCVELWAIDAAGNADHCDTYVIVQDNNGNCAPGDHINVAGAVKTEMTDGVEEATVHINGTSTFAPPYAYFDMSDATGTYEVMNNVPLDATFTIAPEKDDNPLNGVTTYDLVLISKHILGTEPLTSPYKMIAADANKSGSITTFDVVELRKLILGIYTELPSNTSWRFVDKSFVFPNPNNPFQTAFPETISVASAMNNQIAEDFAAIKIGDLNNTVVANATMQAEERTTGTAYFDVVSSTRDEVKAGDNFEVTFTAAQPLKGFQFTMTLDGLQTTGVKSSDNVSANNFGIGFKDATTVSVDGAQQFTLQFKAEKAGKLSEMLGVSGAITRAEAYSECEVTNADCGVVRLTPALRFNGNKVAGLGFELYQNQPNPFVNKTSIGFFLPESADATLSVYDETGRMVYLQKGWFAKGENNITLDRALLNTTGVLYYKLETATDSATRKMIQAK